MEETYITPEIKALIGMEGEPQTSCRLNAARSDASRKP